MRGSQEGPPFQPFPQLDSEAAAFLSCLAIKAQKAPSRPLLTSFLALSRPSRQSGSGSVLSPLPLFLKSPKLKKPENAVRSAGSDSAAVSQRALLAQMPEGALFLWDAPCCPPPSLPLAPCIPPIRTPCPLLPQWGPPGVACTYEDLLGRCWPCPTQPLAVLRAPRLHSLSAPRWGIWGLL